MSGRPAGSTQRSATAPKSSSSRRSAAARLPSRRPVRCAWARTALSIPYHDREWGVPVHDDIVFFEFITLEGAQAGLSWETILKKRGRVSRGVRRFRSRQGRALHTRLASSGCCTNEGIVRNRLKVESTVRNAQSLPRRPEGVRILRRLRLAIRRRRAAGESSADVEGPARAAPSSRTRSARICSVAASSSSARPSATRSCRRLGS